MNAKQINILFSSNNRDEIWETDYVIDTLLPAEYTRVSNFVPSENINFVEEKYDIFVYNCRKHSYEQILNVVKKIKPKIIIHLSDEYHYENLSQYNNLANYCGLFLRQHHHPGFEYEKNVIQIPLGYCNDAGVNGKEIPLISERYLNWSFVGDMKNDRWEMVERFKTINNYFTGCFIDKPKMMKIYLNSIFVPNGRGNSSLNCFRLYEASMTGAIPVVVGDKEEIDCTFKYEESPPWLFFNSWEQASEECAKLLENIERLQEIQNNILSWWKNRIEKIQLQIKDVIENEQIDQKKTGLKVLQVGSNRGYDNLSNHIKENYSSIDFGLFVEANPIHMDSLRECYSEYNNVYFENIAVTYPRRCIEPREIEFFYHLDDSPYYELATSDVQNIKWHTHLPGNIDRGTIEDYENVYNDKIKSFTVPCSTLENLMKSYNIQELDWVFLDTEGIDALILFSTNWEKYNVQKIEFEHIHLHQYENAVEKMFTGMGYKRAEPIHPDNWCFENKNISVESCKDKLKNFPKINYISVSDDSRRRDLLENKFEKYGIPKEHLVPHIFERYKEEDHVIKSEFLEQIGEWKLSVGSRGPVTSHLKAIKTWYNTTDEPYAFFCEDDLGLDTVKYWNFTWEEFFNSLPENWGCVQLVQLREDKIFSFGMGLRNRCWCDWSACAYLITREHAKQLIENYYYDDSFFHLDLKGTDVHGREDWAKIPVVETIIFSSLTRVYTCPLFVEDVNGCSSSYTSLMGISSGQCDVNHKDSYDIIMNWWKNTAKNYSVEQLKTN